ncbi:MAG: Asp-tRNA(Asn)/Glu-tRNA(Gln) amidotransferase GatCAB subunit C [Archaeoglobus sp.]|jgi:aspartyl-tRNA(Asn)/glutamyl-tRNA(Gln) amidotransferase subunit C|nr:MAG: Asp-tRNA(Asn)/Glu-tRNA(Gln) amidotransferase GatCAB subunit C [Archaeoglobus sp.]
MLTIADVYKIAELAKIEITKEEAEKFQKELVNIVSYFNVLDEVEEDVEPTFHVLPLRNVFREDVPEESLSRDEVLANARHRENGYFKGPKIVE